MSSTTQEDGKWSNNAQVFPYLGLLTLSSPQATHFGLIDDLFPTLTPPSSLTNKITINMKPTWKSMNRYRSHAIWRWLQQGTTFIKVGSGYVFVVLDGHVRMLTRITGPHFKANFWWMLMMFILAKMKFFLMINWKRSLHSQPWFNSTFAHSLLLMEFFE